MPCRERSLLRGAPRRPLLHKEMRELLLGRGLWASLLIAVLLSGYSYVQAVQLYGQASQAAQNSLELARGLSPLDGILAPTFGGLYLVSTLLYPLVVICIVGVEKYSGAYQLLLQLPYSLAELAAAKLAASVAAWLLLVCPCLAALGLWTIQGGHLAGWETANLMLGHFLFALVIAGISLFSAAATQSAASASIAAIGVTLGFWVLDFASAGDEGLLKVLSELSLTQLLKSFERGVFSLGAVLGSLSATLGLTAMAGVWLRPDWSPTRKAVNSLLVAALTALAVAGATRIHFYRDAAEDRRNSFSERDEALLRKIDGPLNIHVYLA
ncbi:MAG: ABC transporter permease subunit, partial [Candidatus Saccharimonadales bacterium]